MSAPDLGRPRLALAQAIGAQVAAVGLLLTSGWLIVRAGEHPPVLYLMVAIVGVRFFGIGRAALRYSERLATHDVVLARAVQARVVAHRAIARAGVVARGSQRRGEWVRRIVSDVEQAQDGFVRVTVPWMAVVGAGGVTVVVVAWASVSAAAVLAAQLLLTATILRVVVGRVARRIVEIESSRSDLAGDVTETVRCAPDLLVYGGSEHTRRAHVAIDQLDRAERGRGDAESLTALVVLALAGAASAVAGLSASGVDGPWFAVIVLAPIALIDPLLALGDAERIRPQTTAARQRLAQLTSLPVSTPEPAHPSRTTATSLRVRDLDLGWPGGPVLAADLSFEVRPGDLVAVTGASGSGKSTLAHTLVRAIDPDRGAVLLGDVDVRELSTADVRAAVGLLGQDDPVLDTTLRENLRIARPDASDEELVVALRRCGLAALSDSGPGLDHVVGEAGASLSGGERQRLAMARLLVAGHRYWILDEPTEHLDAAAAQALLDDLDRLRADRGIVVLTHAPAVLERADHVIELEGLRAPVPVGS